MNRLDSTASFLSATTPVSTLLDLFSASNRMLENVFHSSRPKMLRSLVRGVHDLLKAEACALFLVQNAHPEKLYLAASCTDKWGEKSWRKIHLPIVSKRRGGLTSHVAATGEIVVLGNKDFKKNPYRRVKPLPHLVSGQGFSYIGIPLKDRRGRLVGVVTVDNKKSLGGVANDRSNFEKADVAMAGILSVQIAIVLENMRRLDLFAGLVKDLQNARNRAKILEAILHRAIDLLRGDRGDFALFDPARRDIVIAAVAGMSSARTLPIGASVPAPSLMRRAWEDQDPKGGSLVIKDVRVEKDYYNSHPSSRSEVVVRFDANGEPIGILNVESRQPNAFDAQDVDALITLARYASFAVQFAESESRLWNLVEKVLDHAEPSESTLSGVLECVRDLYGFDAGLIYVADYESKLLRYRTSIGCERLSKKPQTFTYRFSDSAMASRIFRADRGFENGYFCTKPEEDKLVNQRGREIFDIRSPMIGVPLRFGKHTVGVLVIWSRNEREPTRRHLELLQPFAKLAACRIAFWESERLRAHSEELYRSLVENLPQKIFRKNLEKRFTFANSAFVEDLQKPLGKIINSTDYAHYSRELADQYRTTDDRVIKTGRPLEGDEPHIPRIGAEKRWVHYTKLPIKNPEGKVVGVQGIFWDVTDAKLRAQLQERWRLLLQVLPDALFLCRDGKIVTVNRSAEHLLGVTHPNKLIGRSLGEFFSPKSNVFPAVMRKGLGKSAERRAVECTFRRHDHVDIEVEITGCTFAGTSGKEQLFVAHNISKRKKHERDLQAAFAEKTVLLTEVHHRVTTSLSYAMAILQMDANQITDYEAREVLSGTQAKIKTIAELHRMICRTEQFAKVNLGDYLKRIVTKLWQSEMAKGVSKPKLSINAVLLDPTTAMYCGLLVHELVVNSLEHAFRSTAKKQIWINATRANSGRVVLEVSDNGAGFLPSFDWRKHGSVGMRVMRLISQVELDGVLEFTRSDNITKARIVFADVDRNRRRISQ